MQPFTITDHELGGKFRWFRLGERAFSVLDDDFPGNDDFELHERVPQDNDDVTDWSVVSGTERHFSSLSEATGWIESQGGV